MMMRWCELIPCLKANIQSVRMLMMSMCGMLRSHREWRISSLLSNRQTIPVEMVFVPVSSIFSHVGWKGYTWDIFLMMIAMTKIFLKTHSRRFHSFFSFFLMKLYLFSSSHFLSIRVNGRNNIDLKDWGKTQELIEKTQNLLFIKKICIRKLFI